MKSINVLCIGSAILFVSGAPLVHAQESEASAHQTSSELKKLVAIIRPIGNSNVQGSVVFEKVNDGILVTAKIGGLAANVTHAIHIHEFGDLGSNDATSAGDHFNPHDQPHAIPDSSNRHAGDLGNLQADRDGNATIALVVDNITLDASKSGILGRAVIVHAHADDGTQPSGNAGGRIAAGVIGISKDASPEKSSPPPEASNDDPGKKETSPTTPDTVADE